MNPSVTGVSRSSGGLIEATRSGSGSGSGLDSAFNAGFDDGFNDGRYAPDSTGGDFSELDSVAPIAPITSGGTSGGQTVQVAGASFETYTVKKGDNLWSIAKRYNVSLNELYAANGMNKNSVLSIGQQIQIPVEGGTATVNAPSVDTYQPTSFNQGSTEYTVKRGDSLSRIANEYDTSVRAIKAANGLSSDLIRVDQKLVIPVSGSTSATSAAPSYSTSSLRTHTVQPGEFPATIARQYAMTTGELLALNGITDPRKLQVGQVLKVSGSGSAANVDSRTETVVAPAPATRTTTGSMTPTTTPTTTVFPAVTTTSPATTTGPVEIKVIEADPLVQGEVTEIETDEMFEGAVEIPVIRVDAE